MRKRESFYVSITISIWSQNINQRKLKKAKNITTKKKKKKTEQTTKNDKVSKNAIATFCAVVRL